MHAGKIKSLLRVWAPGIGYVVQISTLAGKVSLEIQPKTWFPRLIKRKLTIFPHGLAGELDNQCI